MRIPFTLKDDEVEWTAVRAQGAGGQNVNKVASAVHLRFDVRASSLPDELKQRLLERADRRLSDAGVLVIKAQQHRTQEANRLEAMARLREVLEHAAFVPRTRKATKPTHASKQRRLEGKRQRAEVKAGRAKAY